MPFSTSIADDIETVDGVDAVSRMRYANMSFDSDGGQGVAGIEPDTLTQVAAVPMVEGSMSDLRDGTVIVNEGVAEDKNVGVGDEVELSFPTGTEKYEVVGVYEENDPVLWLPYATTLKTLEDVGFPPADSYLLITMDEGVDAAAVQTAVEERTTELPTVTVKDQAGFADEQRAPIDQMLLLIYALLGLALVIAVLGIVNTLALSVIERTREVGLLRAIGLGRGQLRRMIRLEAIVIAVLGAVLGVGMGIVFGIALMTSLADEGLEVVKVPFGQLALYVVAAGLVGVLAAVFPARRAARLDVLRAIATE
jgi:putative ABC transport system permease protein